MHISKTSPAITPEPVTPPEVQTYSQKPGTFEFYYEDDSEKVFTYILKNG